MTNQMVFQRYELKYLMTKWQRDQMLDTILPYMSIDQYGHSEIRNLYYDTNDFRLIRASMERPVYKEKLRLRSYGAADAQSLTFLELKKKYMGVVYKRRISMPYSDAIECLSGLQPMPDSQIGKEIAHTLSRYDFPSPKVFLSYERDAFYDVAESDFRVTFDENIRYRTDHLTLAGGCCGTPLIGQDQVLMELKTSGSLPMWMVRRLSELGIYKTSYSKYASAYTKMLQMKFKGEYRYA